MVERIEFKPRTTVDLTNAKKEMLYGSVIWFKPKQEQDQEQDDGNMKKQAEAEVVPNSSSVKVNYM